MNSLDKMEDYDRLESKIAELNKTLAYHSEKLTTVTRRHCDELDRNCELKKKLLRAGEIIGEKAREIASANEFITKLADLCESHEKQIAELIAKVAMMREAIKEIWYSNSTPIAETKYYEVINATEADVTKFINGVKAEALEEASQKFMSGVSFELCNLAKELRGE